MCICLSLYIIYIYIHMEACALQFVLGTLLMAVGVALHAVRQDNMI